MDLGQLQRISNFLGFRGHTGVQSNTECTRVRIGLLGASQVSTYAVVWPSRRLPSCEVVAVAARDGKRAQDFARWHRISKSYGSYYELLADPSINAVYIGLPNGLHGKWAKRALASGKHVLVEKPFTADAQEAREVQAVARREGLLCREAFHYREHPLHKRLLALMQPPTAGGESGAAAASPLGRIRRIDVRVLIPKWVFGLGNIRFIEGLAGGAMMDAGSYCAHASRELAAAAGATHPLTVTSAAAKLCPACSQTDGAMIVNWSTDPPQQPPSPAWQSWLKGWRRSAPVPAGPQSPAAPSHSPGVIRGQMHASLQYDGLLPISEIAVTGTRGKLLCQGFIVPFFGHKIQLDSLRATAEEPSTGPLGSVRNGVALRKSTTVERTYGSGESTYFYQLERFVRDLQGGPSGSSTASMLRDERDSVANMGFLDQAYLAAGLQPRKPTSTGV